jgi:hypothetical protein
MWRCTETDPDLLTFRQDDGDAARGLGAFLSAAGLFVLYGAAHNFLKHPHTAGDITTGVFCLLIGSFLLLGGGFNLFCKMGLTFDRRKRFLIDWSQTPWGRSAKEQDLRPFDRIAVGRGKLHHARQPGFYPVFPIFLLGPHEKRRDIVKWVQIETTARGFAQSIGDHLGIPVVDLPEDTLSSPD